ncbi:3-oxoacyl-[acyl-carrier-protein] synthase III [Clostridium acetobutylicum]|nr:MULTISPECIES: 3-oxoacyl-ACP synthase III family protein [Clostridium]ADZ21063.1 3-oxoacyl-[acyl-carrier-protein] synthase III [Clostridium acetobutylicum EA 2018]NOV88903.1 3-oxoacyl-[acyl-carrier-protein] synthase III [Clostridium acetobutylicum]NOW12758.1 3-oxoacyl-[acyl-carrier-protein] synthase III [Clostridium acetobutylicum]NRY55134.1 3-oxoacyl-[acyl-carrier-protein] synthase III [Clostridium acetobutylicum]NSA93019.1 3-oxoacyl-[acyl-carrier-protein] synthase III [Clostridium acetobut
MNNYVKLLGIGACLPGNPIKFEDINNYIGQIPNAPKKIKTWISRVQPIMKEMLGIDYCYYAFNGKTRKFDEDNLSLSVKASKLALQDAKIKPQDIDLLIYAGNYSYQMPPISTRIQEELGIDICSEYHIHSNCSSIYKAIKLADTFLKSGEYKNALVVSSMVSSAHFIPEYYNQQKVTKEDVFLRWYLCDGAGAVVLSSKDTVDNGFYLKNTYVESAGGKKESVMGNNFPSYFSNPLTAYENGEHHIRQVTLDKMRKYVVDENGKTIFYNALKRMLDKQKIDLSTLKYFMVNMPSKFVREYITNECVGLGISPDKFYSVSQKIGYAGPPAAIISLDRLLKNNDFKNNDLIFSFVLEVSKFMQGGFTIQYIKE